MRWECPAPDWDTLAGRVIDRFLAGLSEALPEYDSPLTVFGSARYSFASTIVLPVPMSM